MLELTSEIILTSIIFIVMLNKRELPKIFGTRISSAWLSSNSLKTVVLKVLPEYKSFELFQILSLWTVSPLFLVHNESSLESRRFPTGFPLEHSTPETRNTSQMPKREKLFTLITAGTVVTHKTMVDGIHLPLNISKCFCVGAIILLQSVKCLNDLGVKESLASTLTF